MTKRLTVDVAIIGGGTAGCAAAACLREAGLTVALLEKGLCGGGASGVNFGGVRQQGRALPELPLARRARELWDEMPARLGESVEFEATGHLKLARSEADMVELERYALLAKDYGLDLQLLGANALHADHPWLGPKVVGGSLCAEDGQANPRLVAPAYARLARRLGADIREQTRVLAAQRTGTGFDIEAEGLTVASRFLINVAGVQGGAVASWFGEALPIGPLTPNMLVTEPIAYQVTRSIGVVGGDAYVRQVARGNVIFGGGRGSADAELGRSRPKTESSIGAMAKTLEIAPFLAKAHVIRSWTGIDGETPDDMPIIGFSKTTPDLIHATGFSGHGFQLGPVIGEILAELITTGRSRLPLEPFRVDRFVGVTAPAPGDRAVEH